MTSTISGTAGAVRARSWRRRWNGQRATASSGAGAGLRPPRRALRRPHRPRAPVRHDAERRGQHSPYLVLRDLALPAGRGALPTSLSIPLLRCSSTQLINVAWDRAARPPGEGPLGGMEPWGRVTGEPSTGTRSRVLDPPASRP